MAGGKQLKKLRESLKNAGLTEQSFSKKKGKGKKGSQDKLRKDDKEKILQDIREQFNPFDVKISRNKRADAVEKKLTVGKLGISKQIGEESRKKEYEERMGRKGKAGGIIDRRFGEGNDKLSVEDKMLERFTRERLAKASKSSMYNLEDDDNIDFQDGGDFSGLTHLGQSLGANKGTIDDDDFFSKKRTVTDVEEAVDGEEQPERKKTKAEVMKEVIAKSKKYKHERQQQALENQERVAELDDDFDDVMDDISTVNRGKAESATKSKFDVDYEMKVTEAKLDKRAKPTDRTKTEEEMKKEEEERLAELEKKRLARMEGEDEELRADGAVGDDLDDDFWAGSGDEETGFSVGSPAEFNSDAESDVEVEDDEEVEEEVESKEGDAVKENVITIGNKKIVVKPKIAKAKLTCPKTLTEFKQFITKDHEETITTVKKIFETYQPKLAEGNKEKLGVFTTVMFEYLLELSNKPVGFEDKKYVRIMDFLSKTICNLTEKYPEVMLESFRTHIADFHERLTAQDASQFPLQSDVILFTLIGRTFSTSDKYHLVVIPSLVVAGEALEYMKPETSKIDMFFGIFLCDLLMRYERISERVIPEVIYFLHRVLLSVIPKPEEIENWSKILVCSTAPQSTKFNRPANKELAVEDVQLSISKMFQLAASNNQKESTVFIDHMLMKSIKTLDTVITKMIKNTLAGPEYTTSFIPIVKHLIKNTKNTNSTIINVASKLNNINRISNEERRPLKLQQHRAVGIAQIAPRFSERFNPDRKSSRSIDLDPMDPIAVRDEISKLKYQVKEERKQALKELRRDTKFEAREQISRKKKEYSDYHSKMAKIYNSIQTEEGAAKNEYEREKKKFKKGH